MAPDREDGRCPVRVIVDDGPLPPWRKATTWRFTDLIHSLKRCRAARPGDSVFLVPNHVGVSNRKVLTMMQRLRGRAPARAWSRYFMLLPCDHGPSTGLAHRFGQCMFQEDEDALPPFVKPSSPHRRVGFVTLTDSVRLANFRRGLDIRVPQDETHECGPLCGLKHLTRRRALATLRSLSPWALPPRARDEAIATRRPTLLFFAGAIANRRWSRLTAGAAGDPRELLWRHHSRRPGFSVESVAPLFGNLTADGVAIGPHVPMAQRMAASTFCASPPGRLGGDSDRYLPAVLYGCVPVFLEVLERNRHACVTATFARLPRGARA